MDKILGDAFAKYEQAREEYDKAVNEYSDWKFKVETQEAEVYRITSPEEMGKNKETRKAYLFQTTEQEHDYLEHARKEKQKAEREARRAERAKKGDA